MKYIESFRNFNLKKIWHDLNDFFMNSNQLNTFNDIITYYGFFHFCLYNMICWLIEEGSRSSLLTTAIVETSGLISNRSEKRIEEKKAQMIAEKRWSFESDRHLCERLRRPSIGSNFCGTRRQMKSWRVSVWHGYSL